MNNLTITPLPWGVQVVTQSGTRDVEILGANDQTIACNSPESPTPISEADAVLIVMSVNNHGALVDLVRAFMHEAPVTERGTELWRKGRQMLAALEDL